jgi:alpha-tubulin suppressor-like RCC1 family protein
MATETIAEPWERLSCSETHCIALRDGLAYTWAIARTGNRFGQLCTGTAERDVDLARATPLAVRGVPTRIVDVAAGGTKDSGHTALVDADGRVWVCGCDRWQQLGLSGAGAKGNAAGYTWADGKIWQATPQLVVALAPHKIQRVALGGDHSLALDSNGCDVYSWGRGEAGQLADGKPFVRAPARAAQLCAIAGARVRAMAAAHDCSAVALGESGSDETVLVFAGRCAHAVRSRLEAALAATAPPSASAVLSPVDSRGRTQ